MEKNNELEIGQVYTLDIIHKFAQKNKAILCSDKGVPWGTVYGNMKYRVINILEKYISEYVNETNLTNLGNKIIIEIEAKVMNEKRCPKCIDAKMIKTPTGCNTNITINPTDSIKKEIQYYVCEKCGYVEGYAVKSHTTVQE